jgi:hypothetical protein
MPAVRQRSPKVHGVLAVKPSRRAAIEVSKDSSRYGHDAKQHGKEKRERERGFNEFSPAGTAEGCPGLRRGLFSAVPAGLDRLFQTNPGLTSWAKFRRPYGTEFLNGVLTRALMPDLCWSLRPDQSQALIQNIEAVTYPVSTSALVSTLPSNPTFVLVRLRTHGSFRNLR